MSQSSKISVRSEEEENIICIIILHIILNIVSLCESEAGDKKDLCEDIWDNSGFFIRSV